MDLEAPARVLAGGVVHEWAGYRPPRRLFGATFAFASFSRFVSVSSV